MSIDFSKLNLQDALDLAIFAEDDATERYEDFAEQMEAHHTEEAAKFFRFMASYEVRHAEKLRERRRTLFADAPAQVDRSLVWGVEAPEFGEVRAFMSARLALNVSLEAEYKAEAFYAEALEHVTDSDTRELFEQLRHQEVGHQKLLKKELAKLPEEAEVDPDGFVDEPVGH